MKQINSQPKILYVNCRRCNQQTDTPLSDYDLGGPYCPPCFEEVKEQAKIDFLALSKDKSLLELSLA